MQLDAPATYFPIRNGRYDVSPALFRLGTDFGNGPADCRLFQLDSAFARYRANKFACRRERLPKYVCQDAFTTDVARAIAGLFIDRLSADYSALFTSHPRQDACHTLTCALTGDTLFFDTEMNLTDVKRDSTAVTPVPEYVDAFDALTCQIPEDVAVVCRSPERGDWVAALHVCAPSRWAPDEKIGANWYATHAPVPGMEKVRSASDAMVTAMIERAPSVRFTWGIEFDDRLNRHPVPPAGVPERDWQRRTPADSAEPMYLRVERQVIWGLCAVDAALFTIHVYHVPLSALRANPAWMESLRSALQTMPPQSRRYKSLEDCRDQVLALLEPD